MRRHVRSTRMRATAARTRRWRSTNTLPDRPLVRLASHYKLSKESCRPMDKTEQKIVQYLSEAHSTEQALVTVLQSQIAMTPRGSYRDGLESHLRETRDHATRVQRRLDELGPGSSPLQAGVGLVQSIVGQALALGKTPLDLVRGTGGEEKVLKNAKDACATEALEIATYTAIESL